MLSFKNSDTRLPIMEGSPPSLVPPKMDWDRPPWNRWSFQHVREILPTAEVWRGTGPVRDLPRADANLDDLAVVDCNGAPISLSGFLDETYTDGFLVLKNGAISYERYFNGMNERTLQSLAIGGKVICRHGGGHFDWAGIARCECPGYKLFAGA